MAQISINPTRMELKKLKTRYTTARRGHKLLKDKRDELMKRFLSVVRENKTHRERVESALSQIYGSFTVASAVSNPKMMQEALILPKYEGKIGVEYINSMSVIVPQFRMESFTDTKADSYNYGMAFTSGELDDALLNLNSLVQDLIKLAELEKTALLLAQEIERTRRRVNALEHIMIPQYIEGIKSIKMKLDENERGNITRLMKVKDMMVKAQLKHKKDDDEEEIQA
jgi:V/A-type H+-transporting ATPase subunit D